MAEQPSEREALSEVELIERAALRVGMKSLLNHGAASCVYSEGCAGVSQEHLVAFAREVALHCVAALSQPSTEQGWKLVPIEPQSAMLDRAVAFALNVKLSSDYRWTDYMKDLWATMLAGSPPPPIEPREEKL